MERNNSCCRWKENRNTVIVPTYANIKWYEKNIIINRNSDYKELEYDEFLQIMFPLYKSDKSALEQLRVLIRLGVFANCGVKIQNITECKFLDTLLSRFYDYRVYLNNTMYNILWTMREKNRTTSVLKNNVSQKLGFKQILLVKYIWNIILMNIENEKQILNFETGYLIELFERVSRRIRWNISHINYTEFIAMFVPFHPKDVILLEKWTQSLKKWGKKGVFKDSNVILYLNTLLIHLQGYFLFNKNTTFWKISEYSTNKYVYKTLPRLSFKEVFLLKCVWNKILRKSKI